MRWLAFDIGGANLKVADGQGFVLSHYFPLWQRPSKLEQELRTLIAQSPHSDHIVCTMTGELADCFATKKDGVEHILEAFVRACDQRHTRVYRIDGKIVTPQVARHEPLRCAATNWHVLARFAGKFVPSGPALLLDIGSTTCDIIPLENGQPATMAITDTQRLLSGELVYTGVDRSPVCAVAQSIPYRGKQCPLAQELFATMLDVYLTTGDLPDEPTNNVTANGRPATREYARHRLARTICADGADFPEVDAITAAQSLAKAQRELVTRGLSQVLANQSRSPVAVVVSGQGEFLARGVLDALKLNVPVVSLAERLGPKISRVAPAHALAVLANEA
jgi:probable H4MPT-linked C1 transfer pathway protein